MESHIFQIVFSRLIQLYFGHKSNCIFWIQPQNVLTTELAVF